MPVLDLRIQRERVSDADTFAIAVHEYAHELLHKRQQKHQASKTVKETEAEAVAFVVCQSLGLDSTTKSSDYLSLYQGSVEALSESLETIQKTAAMIGKMLDAVANDRPTSLVSNRTASASKRDTCNDSRVGKSLPA